MVRIKLTNKEFKKKLYLKFGDRVVNIEPYQGSATKIRFRCLVNKEHPDFYRAPNNMLNSVYCCPLCSSQQWKHNSITEKEFESRLLSITGGAITNIESIKDVQTPILFHCNRNLNHEDWKMRPAKVLYLHKGKYRSGCPKCNKYHRSRGEQFIGSILDLNKISYEYQYPFYFRNHHHNGDFYLPNYHLAIEADGSQHYDEDSPWYRGELDRDKDDYYRLHNIKVLRIKQEDFFINNIIDILEPLLKVRLKIPTEFDLPIFLQFSKMVEYYKTHDLTETARVFKMSKPTVYNSFRQITGTTKGKYKESQYNQIEIADYYLCHNLAETLEHFNIRSDQLQKFFKNIYGTTKTKYLK